ncbi:MAG: LamG domain-containing protein [Bacteroidales bacterium]|nr:LamG domain-containing protein [Bacteroidales bacterium]MBO4565678.1 LamG domain-containing protein [Bacteroidales bacterium]
MKKLTLFAAASLMLALLASCKPGTDDPAGPDEPAKPEVLTAKDNLVLHFSFEANEAPGTGVAFVESKGSASLDQKGFIGKGWTNTSGNNLTQAYTKYSVASSNALSGVKDITFTAWVKLIESCSKGAILSLNGMPSGFDWPLFIAYFDNSSVGDDGVKSQQVNGRLVFHDGAGNEQNLWLDTWDPAFAKYDSWFQFAFTYQHDSGDWALYVDGVQVKTANFEPKIEFSNLLTASTNALYVGGWASFIEGASTQDWQSYFAGSMDEIRIYNRVLSESELQALRKEELVISLDEAE